MVISLVAVLHDFVGNEYKNFFGLMNGLLENSHVLTRGAETNDAKVLSELSSSIEKLQKHEEALTEYNQEVAVHNAKVQKYNQNLQILNEHEDPSIYLSRRFYSVVDAKHLTRENAYLGSDELSIILRKLKSENDFLKQSIDNESKRLDEWRVRLNETKGGEVKFTELHTRVNALTELQQKNFSTLTSEQKEVVVMSYVMSAWESLEEIFTRKFQDESNRLEVIRVRLQKIIEDFGDQNLRVRGMDDYVHSDQSPVKEGVQHLRENARKLLQGIYDYEFARINKDDEKAKASLKQEYPELFKVKIGSATTQGIILSGLSQQTIAEVKRPFSAPPPFVEDYEENLDLMKLYNAKDPTTVWTDTMKSRLISEMCQQDPVLKKVQYNVVTEESRVRDKMSGKSEKQYRHKTKPLTEEEACDLKARLTEGNNPNYEKVFGGKRYEGGTGIVWYLENFQPEKPSPAFPSAPGRAFTS